MYGDRTSSGKWKRKVNMRMRKFMYRGEGEG